MSAIEPAERRTGAMARAWRFVRDLWDVLLRPSSVFGLGVLVLAGFVAGVIFWGGFNTALELTNTEKFCTGCHVPQVTTNPPVSNDFVDIDTMLSRAAPGGRR